jgi:hypothetical protein
MPSNDPFSILLIWILPLLGLLGQIAVLVACIFGALHPSLRREFICLALGSALRCVGVVVILVPQLVRTFSSPSSLSVGDYELINTIGGLLSVFSYLLYLVGFILLAVKARSLPVPPR